VRGCMSRTMYAGSSTRLIVGGVVLGMNCFHEGWGLGKHF